MSARRDAKYPSRDLSPRGRLYRRQDSSVSNSQEPTPGSSSNPPPSSDQPPSSNSPTSSTTPPPSSSTPTTSSTPTSNPPTSEPPTSTPPTSTPPTSTPPTSTPPISTPPTSTPPTSSPTTSTPTTSDPASTSTSTTIVTPPASTTTTQEPPSSASTSTTVVIVTDDTYSSTPTSTSPGLTTYTRNGTTVVVSMTATGQFQSEIAHAGGNTHANVGAIVGGVLGAAVALGAIVGLLLFCRHRRRKQRYDGVPQMPPRPSWTPLSPVATGAATLSPDPTYEPYYDSFQRYDPSGPCSTQPTSDGHVRSNPNSQYSTYSQLSTIDPTPESSTRQLLSAGSGAATAGGVAGGVPGGAAVGAGTAVTGAAVAGAGVAGAGARSARSSDDDIWNEARMYQTSYLPEPYPINRAEHTGTPSSAYAWGAAQPKRQLGMTNPDPETPDTPKSSYFGLSELGDGSPGVSAPGAGSGAAAVGVSAAAAGDVPLSPPRPPKSERRLSNSPLVVAANIADQRMEQPPLSAVGTTDSDPFRWDAMSTAQTALTTNSTEHSQPGLAFSTPSGADQPVAGAGRLPVTTAGASVQRQETLPPYQPEWENRLSGSTFGDMKRELRERSRDTN
ncbi:hypothetical protein CcaverHIS631_0607170 [Cutaneotrichosporon cavernicola]|nr:hypothetical protein CcaverHIS631_0607170 [Cutaneotrichosporon cavernicola]